MVLSPILITAIVFFGVRLLVVDNDAQTRGGAGGRFADMPHIPVVGSSQAVDVLVKGDFTYITGGIALYHSNLGDFIVIVPDYYAAALADFTDGPDFVLPVILFYLFAVVVLANILLARYITRRIMMPINTLASGVQEISGGNLTHRINYNGGDEFDAVCADFNEMAVRLHDMVAQRQADENSRKELIAGISHDLRTPLTSVKAYIEGLKKGVAATPEMQEKYLDIIGRKTDDIEHIIKQLFMFSQIDIGEFPLDIKVVDIGAELAKMVSEFAQEYKTLDITLTSNIHGACVAVDIIQFKNVVQNILSNSAKYCNRADARAEISCDYNENDISIAIEDNGTGVPEEKLTKIFDVFYRSDESRHNPGSGLGLAISTKIIKRLGGTIVAENAPTGGLKIVISLPKAVQNEKDTDN